MSSYVLDNRTLFKDIFQIRAGEMIFLPSFKKHQYFKFYPTKILNDNIHNLSKQLENITNTIIKRIIDKYEGKKILVPLSGGLDSRLVLAKLVEHGYQNLEAVTYGINNNGELKIAKEVAKKLKVKWTFVPTNNHESKNIFFSKKRKEYWDTSSGYCVLPNMQEFHLMHKLNNENKLKNFDVVVNGQAGDFITGGHLNHIFKNQELNLENFLDIIINKNFNLWSDLVNESNLKYMKQQIHLSLKYYLEDNDKSSFNAYDAQLWEWSERQSKFVSNQQRVYEFFNLEWYLPLWDREYIDFGRIVQVIS